MQERGLGCDGEEWKEGVCSRGEVPQRRRGGAGSGGVGEVS